VTAPASARALVLAQREAAALAMCAAYAASRMFGATCLSIEHRAEARPCRYCRAAAAKRYPLPTITRPRIVTDRDGYRWAVIDGALMMARPGVITSEWTWAPPPPAAWNGDNYPVSMAALKDLITSDTETVPDDGDDAEGRV
jgi:hypothetical protein